MAKLHDRGLVFAREQPSNWGVANRIGEALDYSVVRDLVRKLCEAANVRRIAPHGLRHTSATLALDNGEHPKVVSERLGHTRIEMTLNIYAHTLPSMQENASSNRAHLHLLPFWSAST